MKHKGITGVGVIIIILAVLLVGYIGYQIGRPQFTYSAIKGQAENAAELGLAQADDVTRQELVETARDQHLLLLPEQILIDHSLQDSIRIYIEYDDSSSVFGIYTYRKHYIVDIVKRMKST